MLDIRLIREKPDFVRERLATRGGGDEAKIDDVLRRIDETAAAEGKRPLVFSSIVDEVMSAQLGRANAMVLDLFQVFIAPLEAELAAKSSHAA